MPMSVEMCANCGCSEFAHHHHSEDDDEWGEGEWSCDCGRCRELVFIPEPDEVVCECGCLQHAHHDGDGACECGECAALRGAGTVLDRVRAEVRHSTGRPTDLAQLPRAPLDRLRVDWLDEPLEVTAALVSEGDRVVRVEGPPDPAAAVLVYLAVARDGLEVAISRHELVD